MPITSTEDLGLLAEYAAPSAQEIPAQGGRYYRWSSPEGAELWMQVDEDNELAGVTPFFRGPAQFKVTLTEWIKHEPQNALDGTLKGWMEPDEETLGEGIYPFLFDLPDAGCHRELTLPCIATVSLSVFVHEIHVYENKAAFDAAKKPVACDAESFIPSGLFAGEFAPPEAQGIFSGKVLSAKTCTNPLTQQPYYTMQVKTLDCEFSVVVDVSMIPTLPVAGNIVLCGGWICGQIIAT